MAEGVGFEPTGRVNDRRFQDRCFPSPSVMYLLGSSWLGRLIREASISRLPSISATC